MMMKPETFAIPLLLLLLLLLLAFVASTAQATSMTVDLEKLDPKTAAEVLQQVKSTPPNPVDEAKKWAGVGQEIGNAVAATARALSVETNDFIKTPVGKITFVILAWYLIGHKIWTMIGGILLLTIGGRLWWKSFKYFYMSDDKGYQFCTGDGRMMSVVLHVAVGFSITLASLLMIF